MRVLVYGAVTALTLAMSTAGWTNEITKGFQCFPVAGSGGQAYALECTVRWGESYVHNCVCEKGFTLVDLETLLPPPSPTPQGGGPNNATDG